MPDLTTNTLYPQQVQGKGANPQNQAARGKPAMGSIPQAGAAPVNGAAPAMGTVPAGGTVPPGAVNPAMGTIPAGGAVPPGTINPAMTGVDARRYAGDNTAGAAADNVTKTGNPITTYLLGYGAAVGSEKLINRFFLNNEDYDQTKFKKFLDRMDKSEFGLEGSKGRLKRLKEAVKSSPVGALRNKFNNLSLVKYIKKHSGVLKPKSAFAYATYRHLDGEIMDELIDKTRSVLINKEAGNFAGEFVETTEKKGLLGITKKTVRKLKPTAKADDVIRKFGINPDSADDIANLPKKATKLFRKCQNAVKKGNKNAEKKFLGKLIDVVGKEHGKKHVGDIIKLSEKFSVGALSTEQAMEEFGEIAKKTGIAKEKFYIDCINNVKSVMHNPKGGFFSGAVKTGLKAFKRFCRLPLVSAHNKLSLLTIVMTPFFIGGAIKKTFDAPKEDKFSTLMEATVGEILPFWLLFSPLMRGMEDGINILQNIPKFGKIDRMLAKGGKNLFSVKDAAGNVIGKTISRKGKPDIDALKLFMKLKNRMASGKGTMPGLFKSGTTAKAMKALFKQTLPFTKRFGINLVGALARAGSGIGKLLAVGLDKGPNLAKMGGLAARFAGPLGFAFGLVRLALFAKLLQPVMEKFFMKASHTLFGKPQKTIDEENALKAEKAASAKATAAEEAEKQARQQANNGQYRNMPLPVNPDEPVSPFIKQYKEVIKRDRLATGQPAAANPVSDQATPVMPNIYADDDVQPLYSGVLSAGTPSLTSVPDNVGGLQKAAEFNAAIAGVDRDIMRAEQLLSGH